MTETEHKLRAENERLKKIAINLKVKLNASEATIRKLEHQLAEARHTTQSMHTIDKLEILCENEFDNGQDPIDTSQYRNPLED